MIVFCRAGVWPGGGEIMKGREKMNRKLNIVPMVMLIALIVPGIFAGCSGNITEISEKPKKDYSNIVENPNISIPGYESLELKAKTLKQSVDFYNPEENTCFFKISLVLKDGDGSGSESVPGDDQAEDAEEAVGQDAKETENIAGEDVKEKESIDGADPKEEVLWTSDYIEPGEHVRSIELNKELESGEYAATLKYECFRLIDETPLNGSNIELKLNVRSY